MIAVVYLAWAPAGLDPVRAFIASYRRHDSGIAHELIVVLKEFADDAATAEHRRVLAEVVHQELLRPARIQDIPAYVDAAATLDQSLVCCLNSQSVVLDDGWLAKLVRQARRDDVGMAGATGSWESRVTGARHGPAPDDPLRTVKGVVGGLLARRHFPPFPNPHLRTNAFVMERDLLLRVAAGPLKDKEAVQRFESGHDGFTERVRRRGLEAVVVGRDGVGYEARRWPQSQTYRSGTQRNLLVADNRTRVYAQAEPGERRALGTLAWGNAYVDAEDS